jgi:type II secretory pathway pseudopilin PulG
MASPWGEAPLAVMRGFSFPSGHVILRRSPKRYPQRIPDLVGFPSGGKECFLSPHPSHHMRHLPPWGKAFFIPPLLTIHLLIVVIAIMAILAAVLVPTVVNKINDAKESAAKSDMSTVANAIQSEIISITSGLPAAGNKYVAGDAGAVTGVKTPKGTSGEDALVQEVGKVTISYVAATTGTPATPAKFVITHKDLTNTQTYEVNAETGAVTNNAQ